MLFRVNTAKNGLPQPHQDYLKHREEMKERTRELFSKQSSRSSQRKISTALFTTTSRSNNFFKPHSQQDYYRERGSIFTQRQEPLFRPLTHNSGRCHRAQSPLSVIKTKSKALSNEDSEMHCLSSRNLKQTKYLRRGSAIDKAIISNVLKSKFNKNICASAFSYSDRPENNELLKIISNQIPNGIKDVVGVEEMLRMSHIFTGTPFPTSNLTKKLNSTLNQAKVARKESNAADQQDTITLKSIKRW